VLRGSLREKQRTFGCARRPLGAVEGDDDDKNVVRNVES